MQPLMNMITFTARDRARIVDLHSHIADAIEAGDGPAAVTGLADLESETRNLAADVFSAKTTSPPSARPAPA
jgi:DNA-binding GntR family transcriptional regulator